MTPHRDFLVKYREFEKPYGLTVGNGESVYAYGTGLMPFESGKFVGKLQQVPWAPELSENLFSVCSAMQNNCDVKFDHEESSVLFFRNGQLVLKGNKYSNSVYFLLTLMPRRSEAGEAEGALLGATAREWHKRFSHCSMDMVHSLLKSNAVTGMKVTSTNGHECKSCIMGKLCRAHHPTREHIQADKTGAVLHFDTVGPLKTASLGGSRYFVLATEESSDYKYLDSVAFKASIGNSVKRIINKAELDSGLTVKAIVTDQGSEFMNQDLRSWLIKRGIVHSSAAIYTPQQNGRAERANRTIIDGIRTLLSDSKLPEELWAEAAQAVVYTSNRLIKHGQDKTRYELFRGDKPNVGNLRSFGQSAIIRMPDAARDSKLCERGKCVRLVGYTDRYNTYRFFSEDPHQHVIEACDVKFLSGGDAQPEEEPADTIKLTNHDAPTEQNPPEQIEPEVGQDEAPGDGRNDNDSGDDYTGSTTESSSDSDETVQAYPTNKRVTRSASKNAQYGPILDGVHLATHEGSMFTLNDEPKTIRDARESDVWNRWKAAMDEEIEALDRNETWVLVEKPPKVKPIGNKWVFKLKLRPNGEIERFKARLVAKGYTQVPNVDYKETYSPVASMNTIRMFLATANQNRMQIIQFDIKTAFLYGDLDETLYMDQPEGYTTGDGRVCKLVKSLYGLKQAPRQWNKKFDHFLKLFNLKQASIDKCLYNRFD